MKLPLTSDVKIRKPIVEKNLPPSMKKSPRSTLMKVVSNIPAPSPVSLGGHPGVTHFTTSSPRRVRLRGRFGAGFPFLTRDLVIPSFSQIHYRSSGSNIAAPKKGESADPQGLALRKEPDPITVISALLQSLSLRSKRLREHNRPDDARIPFQMQGLY